MSFNRDPPRKAHQRHHHDEDGMTSRLRGLIGAGIVALLMAHQVSSAQALIHAADSAHFSFGRIQRGEILKHDVAISNPGNDTLRVTRVDVSCGCTGSAMSSDRVAPGEKASLHITFTSSNFRGPIHKSVTVTSNAANQPSMVIEFDGDVFEVVSVTPDYLWFQDLKLGERMTKSLTISNQGTAPFLIDGYETNLEGVSAELPPDPIQGGRSAEVKIIFAAAKKGPVISGKITLHTTNPVQKEINIGIYGSMAAGGN
jgi:hypothetical protein